MPTSSLTQNADNSYTLAAPGVTPSTSPTSFGATGAINSTVLAPQSPIQVPPPPSLSTGAAVNASIPDPQSIVDQSTKPTSTDTTNSDLLTNLAGIIGSQKSLATQQNTTYNAAGIPALAATQRSLSNQLQGYNDQAQKLQLDASAGGTIQNQLQQSVEGRGVTAGGLAPLQTAALRNNQIQQASISAQALTTKAALYAAQNDYATAKDAADKAAQVAFDAQTQQINGLKAQLDAIKPTLDREQTARAALMQSQLTDRQNQIKLQQDNFKTGQAAIMEAMKNNPTDGAAQFAAQSALKLDPNDPAYLQKVNALVGNYTSDLTARALKTAVSSSSGAASNTSNSSNDTDLIAKAIVNGNQPPVLTGLYGKSAAVRASLEKQGYNLTKATQDWTATQKLLTTLNGAQQTRLREAVGQVDESLGLVQQLADQWNGSKFPILNQANLIAAKNGIYGSAAQSLATRLDAEIADITSELGTVYKGGNSSTDESLKLAAQQLSSSWSKSTFDDAIQLARQNIQYRKNSLQLTTAGIQNSQFNSSSSASNDDPLGLFQ